MKVDTISTRCLLVFGQGGSVVLHQDGLLFICNTVRISIALFVVILYLHVYLSHKFFLSVLFYID